MDRFFRIEAADGVATIWLDAQNESVNTVSPDWIEAMMGLFGRIRDDDSISGVIITSAKGGFMAGADLKYILAEGARYSLKEAYDFSQRASAMHRLIETCGKPVAAAINGFALGGGYELALACHRRIVADDPKAVIGLPEVNVGLLPGSGGTQRLPRMIGAAKAFDVLLTGASYRPADALALGLVDEMVAPNRLQGAARAWLDGSPSPRQPWDCKGYQPREYLGLLDNAFANLMTAKTAELSARFGVNYPAPIAILTCVFEGLQAPLDAGLRIESRHFARLLVDPTAHNIIRTLFVNKGLAEKGAQRPEGFERTQVRKIGVLGAGMMGAGIAYAAAAAHIDVVLLDTSEEAAAKGKTYSEKLVTRQVAKGARTQAAADAVLSRITPTTDYAALAGCELVVEAVFEDAAVKADVVRKTEAVLGADTVFASNTSTLPITGLAKASKHPERFLGLHFFSPVERMDLVEVIRGARTRDETLARALDFVAQLRKTPIVVSDSCGFYTSRVFQTFIHEGAAMLGEGIKPALIENAAKSVGMPIGPLALLDEVTIDLPLKIVEQAIEAEGDAYTPPCGTPVMRRMRDKIKRPSRKAGGGFYEYLEGDGKKLWTGLSQAFPQAAEQPAFEELRRRFLYVQALETVRCLEEGVLINPAEADLGAVLGWGFPSWTGGTLSLIDTIGVAPFVQQCDALAQKHGARFAPTTRLRAMAERGERFHACAA